MLSNHLKFAVCLLLLWGCSSAQKTIVIYHTSDVHGGIQARKAWWNKSAPNRRVGGYAALSALVKKETKPYVLLDSGDIFQGTPEGNLTRGQAVIAGMNALKYRAMAIGNHEYDYGEANLVQLEKKANFPMLAANITNRATGKRVDYAKPTAMITVGGLKLGLIGIATRHTATSTMPAHVRHLRFEDEAKMAALHAKKLRKRGADVVIVLSHCGLARSLARKRIAPGKVNLTRGDLAYKGDLYIARNAPVDIVLGGHMHVGLEAPYRDPKSGVYIVQSFDNLLATSRVEITVSNEGLTVQGQLIDLWVDETGEDPAVLDVLKPYVQHVGKTLNKRIGTATSAFVREGHALDNPLGNWMADVMRQQAKADIGVQNTYGIRANIQAGPITLRSIYQVMPFENTLVLARLTGRSVLKMVQSSLRGGKLLLQMSGLKVRFKWDAAKEKATVLEVTHKGEAIDPKRAYTIATNNYLVSGGSAAGPLSGAPSTNAGLSLRQVVVDYVKNAKTITPPAIGRFVLED